MAERRMFAKTIIDSDAFLDMPVSSQNLYFHLSMRADDDGFINNPKKILRMVNASEDDLRLLLGKRFLIGFETGVVVIKHWRIHNYIQSDRYKATVYVEEKSRLEIKENKGYTLKNEMDTGCIQIVSNPETQVRLGKDSVEIVNDNMGDSDKPNQQKRTKFIPPSLDDVKEYFAEKGTRIDPVDFFEYYRDNDWKQSGGKKVKDWKKCLTTWERNDKNKPGGNRPPDRIFNQSSFLDMEEA